MTDKEKLEKIIAEIDNLVNHAVTANTPAFRAWKNETERFLIKRFGENSYEYENFMDTKFSPTVYVMDTDLVKKCREGLTTSKLVFQSYLSEMDEEAVVPITPRNADSFNKVFIVHGHDGELKHAVARLIEKQGLDAIILSEQANKGKTIIEKFEESLKQRLGNFAYEMDPQKLYEVAFSQLPFVDVCGQRMIRLCSKAVIDKDEVYCVLADSRFSRKEQHELCDTWGFLLDCIVKT